MFNKITKMSNEENILLQEKKEKTSSQRISGKREMKNQEPRVSTESTGVCTDHVTYVVEGKYFVTLDTK